jgi:hypothetical protein
MTPRGCSKSLRQASPCETIPHLGLGILKTFFVSRQGMLSGVLAMDVQILVQLLSAGK